jgi:hypothetical protein
MWLHLGSSVTVVEGPAITVDIGLAIYIRAPVGGQYGFELEVARGRAVDTFVEYSFINPLGLEAPVINFVAAAISSHLGSCWL